LSRVRNSAEWRFLAVLPKAARGLAYTWWALIAARGTLPALFTLAMGAVVGAVVGHHPLAGPLTFAGAVFIALNALGPIHEAVGGNLGAKAGAWLHDRLMEACVTPPGLAHLERPELGDELNQARQFDLGVNHPSLAVAMPEIASGFAEIAAGIGQAIVLAFFHWWAPLLVGGAWAATHVLLRETALWRIYGNEDVILQQRHATYAYNLGVRAEASKEIRLFGLADWATNRFADRRRRVANALFNARKLQQRSVFWSLVFIVAANAIVFWLLAHDATSGRLALSSVVVFAGAAVGCSSLSFGEFDWWFRGSAQPVPKVLDLADHMGDVGALDPGTRDADRMPSKDIRFQGVRFAYPGTQAFVLDGFDLTIPAGRSLAIVGQNGAGKTTLAKLLCRLYDPVDGAVLVDGTDIRSFDVESWRSRIAAVFQDFVRYELPLRDNVAPGGAPEKVVVGALQRAHAGDLASLDTPLSKAYDGGTDLSGGQWQRVALARALCSVSLGAGLVILDEPTAQLDVRGEAEIFDSLLEATGGATTILISHRFSTVRHADLICVLEKGHVIELGTHEELIAKDGRYKTMFDLQASRFGEDTDGEV
jgi:ATP-binding cassette, subfamily B, bacterial